jgi:hypothetical protein
MYMQDSELAYREHDERSSGNCHLWILKIVE